MVHQIGHPGPETGEGRSGNLSALRAWHGPAKEKLNVLQAAGGWQNDFSSGLGPQTAGNSGLGDVNLVSSKDGPVTIPISEKGVIYQIEVANKLHWVTNRQSSSSSRKTVQFGSNVDITPIAASISLHVRQA